MFGKMSKIEDLDWVYDARNESSRRNPFASSFEVQKSTQDSTRDSLTRKTTNKPTATLSCSHSGPPLLSTPLIMTIRTPSPSDLPNKARGDGS
jgi:hypothetical protein